VVSHDRMDEALASVEGDIDDALRAAAALIRELKKAKTAAAGGSVRDLARSLEAAGEWVDETAGAVMAGEQGWDFDVSEYLASGGWAKEVIAAAAARGLTVTESDDRLVCYPSLVKVLPGDVAIDIDRKRDRHLRPSVVVDTLAARQARPPRFRTEPFLEALADGYGWVVERGGQRSWGAVVRLVDIWGVLTVMPGASRDYPKPEFARDLYLLDQSGVTATRAGRTLRFSASTGTRSAGVLTTVAADGRPVHYWGVAFS
jgi:hypothetical protein